MLTYWHDPLVRDGQVPPVAYDWHGRRPRDLGVLGHVVVEAAQGAHGQGDHGHRGRQQQQGRGQRRRRPHRHQQLAQPGHGHRRHRELQLSKFKFLSIHF